jgi:hypothetical protein
LHRGFLLVFMLGVVFSALFTVAEVRWRFLSRGGFTDKFIVCLASKRLSRLREAAKSLHIQDYYRHRSDRCRNRVRCRSLLCSWRWGWVWPVCVMYSLLIWLFVSCTGVVYCAWLYVLFGVVLVWPTSCKESPTGRVEATLRPAGCPSLSSLRTSV